MTLMAPSISELCIAAMLMTSPGLAAFAEDISIDESSITEVEHGTDESVTEENTDESETEEPYVIEEEYLEPEDLIVEGTSIGSESTEINSCTKNIVLEVLAQVESPVQVRYSAKVYSNYM